MQIDFPPQVRDNCSSPHGLFFPASAGVTQLVECNLAKVDVAGSNPVSRSNYSCPTML